MRVWLGSGPALGRTLPPRRPGRIAVLALAASGFSGAARPPPLKRTARPPRGARAEYEEEKFAVPGGGGEPEPSDPPFSSVRGGGRVPGGPPGGPELRSGGWRLEAGRSTQGGGGTSPASSRRGPRSSAGTLRNREGEGRIALPRGFVKSSGGSCGGGGVSLCPPRTSLLPCLPPSVSRWVPLTQAPAP